MTTQEERQRVHDREERLEEARDRAARAYWARRLPPERRTSDGRPIGFTFHAPNCTCLFCKESRKPR